MRKTKIPHETPARPKPRVEIIEKEGQPTECRVTVDGVLVFDGVSRDALVRESWPPAEVKVPELKPYAQVLTFMANGALVDFYITEMEFSSSDGFRFQAQDAETVRAKHTRSGFPGGTYLDGTPVVP